MMMMEAQCFVDKKAPTWGKTVAPVLKGGRLRSNLFLFDCRQDTTESGYSPYNPAIKQEEIRVFDFVGPIIIQMVAYRFQHILPGYIKRESRAFWSKDANTFVFDEPPCNVINVVVSGRKEFPIIKGGIW
jgi:hypothetical protein